MVYIIFSLCLGLLRNLRTPLRRQRKLSSYLDWFFDSPRSVFLKNSQENWVDYTKSRPSESPSMNKEQSSKKKKKTKQENDQKRNRSKEVCFSSSSWKKLVETYKKKRTANRNKTNHEQVYSTYSERFWCQETYWTRTVTNHTNSNFNLVSCTQVLRLCYEIIPFIVSSGNLSNSRKWLVTNAYDFCPPISHSFFVFRFLEDSALLSNELWLKASIPSFITAARLSPPARFRER